MFRKLNLWYQQFNIFVITLDKNKEINEGKINILLYLIDSFGHKIYNNFQRKKLKLMQVLWTNVKTIINLREI